MQVKLSQALKYILGVALISLGVWVALQNAISIPNKYYLGSNTINFPFTLFISVFFGLIGTCFLANAFAPLRTVRFCKVTASAALALLFVGYVLLDPLFG